jgi:hypothetical protein
MEESMALQNPSQYPPPVPGLQFLAKFEVELGLIQELGDIGIGRRRVIPITGGHFEGPDFKGKVLSLGADWQLVYHDGTAVIDTRYGLETDDGALIYITTNGFRHGPPEVIAAIGRGEPVDPAKYYFRVNVRFETGASKYLWLNRTLAVGAGMRLANSVLFTAYRVT